MEQIFYTTLAGIVASLLTFLSHRLKIRRDWLVIGLCFLGAVGYVFFKNWADAETYALVYSYGREILGTATLFYVVTGTFLKKQK